MNVTVERLSFFSVTGGGLLRFAEHAPAGSGKTHSECGCTKDAATRPSGPPTQVQQEIYVEGNGWQFRLASRWYTFGEFGGAEHAYVIFGEDFCHARLEVVPVPGCGLMDAFFGDVYLGNRVDVSRLYNGFAPSRVVRFDEIHPQQVWTHACCWGKEAVRLFTDDVWRDRFALAASVDSRLRPYREDTQSPVADLRERVLADVALLADVAALRESLRPLSVVDELRKTETFLACEAARQEVEPPRTSESDRRLSEWKAATAGRRRGKTGE